MLSYLSHNYQRNAMNQSPFNPLARIKVENAKIRII